MRRKRRNMAMNEKPKILIADDSEINRALLKEILGDGYDYLEAEDGAAAVELMRQRTDISLLLLDLMMPGEDGLTLCRELRVKSRLPIIMLTAMGEETDRIIGLEMGADDYLSKPFNPRELLARIKAVMRRTQAESLPVPETLTRDLRFDRWLLDVNRRELVDEEGVGMSLSTAEFDLLKVFLERPQRVLSRDQLLDLARGREAVAFDRAIDTLVSRLRRKLERDPKNPELIKTIWGGSYLFAADVTQE
jgi:two-component system OmpR family response regulator